MSDETRELINLAVGIGTALLLVGLLRQVLTSRLVSRWPFTPPIVRRCVRPGFATALVTGALLGLPSDGSLLPDSMAGVLEHALIIAVIAAVTWLIIQAAYAATEILLGRLTDVEGEGERNRRAQRIRTQVMLLRRTVAAAIVVIAIGAMLFTFPAVKALGAGVLASAGLVGIVAGVAAQSTLGNVFAGLQLAFGDALRIDDVVVVEDEWGRIEELTLTYVVLRLWDERRLVLPVSYFAQNPFENWTLHGSRVAGTVMLYVDWLIPVDELRAELYAILDDHPLWDRREGTLQVTDVLPGGSIELRAFMSAADSTSAWELRCDVRERLVRYIRENHPDALPRVRAELGDGRGSGVGQG